MAEPVQPNAPESFLRRFYRQDALSYASKAKDDLRAIFARFWGICAGGWQRHLQTACFPMARPKLFALVRKRE
jgi:hypothetical protein